MFAWCLSDPTGPNGGTGIGNFTDWYIPAQNELTILCNNLGPNWTTNSDFQGTNAQAFSTGDFYWSSTENPAVTTDAWRRFFGNGFEDDNGKTTTYYARAVRRELA
jgi:hypothetical protein